MDTLNKTWQSFADYRPTPLPEFDASFIWPRYGGLSVGNLSATAANMLGGVLPGGLPALAVPEVEAMADGVQQVILLVLDGLGWLQLQHYMASEQGSVFHRIAESGCLVPITSGFLSTTNSVLSTIWTGQPPIVHGLLAYELYLREWMMAVEAISFGTPHVPFSATLADWGFKAESFLPVPSLGQILSVQGLLTYHVTAKAYANSHLTRMHSRGTREVRTYVTASDFWAKMRHVSSDVKKEKSLVTGYWSAVDTLAHAYGPQDELCEMEIRSLDCLMDRIFLAPMAQADREGTLLLITADHGQIETPEHAAILLHDHPDLVEGLIMPPLGEARVPFFYVRQGYEDAVWRYLHEHFGQDFVFLTRQQVITSGLLGHGEMYEEIPHRLGDFIGIARGNRYFVREPALVKKLRGKHGGLSPEEMLVPLMAVRLDRL